MYKTLFYFLPGLAQRLARAFVKPAATESFQEVASIRPGNEINCVLVHAFSLGSELAFRSIYDHYAPVIYQVSLRCFRSGQLAEDLVSEVFAALWHRRVKFSEPEEVRLFLFTKGKSVAVKYLARMVEERHMKPKLIAKEQCD